MDNQRFSQQFMRPVIAFSALALLFSLYRLPFSQLGVPFLLLALMTINLGSRFTIPIPRGRGHLSVTDSLVFLAVLLFDGEAAIVLAALTAFCISLQRSSSNPSRLLFHASVTVITAFLGVWTLRFNYGPIAELGHSGRLLDSINAVCIMILVQAVFTTTIVVIGGAYKIKQSLWRTWGSVYFWTCVTLLTGAIGAIAVSALIGTISVNAFIASTTFLAILYFAYSAYQKQTGAENLQAERHVKTTRENSDRFRSAFDHAAIGMALVSSEGRWLQVNHSLCQLLGYTERELLGSDFLRVTHQEDLATSLANIKQLLQGKIPTCQMEKRYVHKLGHEVCVLWSASMAKDDHTKSTHLIFQIQDITDRKRSEEKLLHDAFHDSLTGLPNRALFVDHLKLAIARSQRREEQVFAVLYLDLDRFKIINDSLGHMIGDQLLVGIAQRLEKCIRPGDTIARLGGDEFTILVEDIADEADAIFIAERIQQELSAPFTLSGREVFTTVSIGIAPSSTGYERAEDILRDADTAMYRAKTHGKARHEIFDKAMHARAVNLLQLETDLRRAVERQEFFIHYQPVVALENMHLRGFEALVRWQHPERGLISPVDFIPVAEETGLIIPLGEWVLREACHQMQRWQTMFPTDPPLFISVNLSGKQFTQPDLIDKVADILRETRINPSSLKLEITESVVMESIETATEMLSQLRALGVKLSIDDFGTGYSSLSYLHRFPIDTLKIDRSFVMLMEEDNENTEIVRTIVVLAQNLGMDVIAEGVETKEQLALLRKLGCENGQGYYFSKPVDETGAEKVISDTYSSPKPVIATNKVQKVLLVA